MLAIKGYFGTVFFFYLKISIINDNTLRYFQTLQKRIFQIPSNLFADYVRTKTYQLEIKPTAYVSDYLEEKKVYFSFKIIIALLLNYWES